MLPDRVLNPGPLTYESGALPPTECTKLLLVFINTYSKPGGIMKNMVINDRLLLLSATVKQQQRCLQLYLL